MHRANSEQIALLYTAPAMVNTPVPKGLEPNLMPCLIVQSIESTWTDGTLSEAISSMQQSRIEPDSYNGPIYKLPLDYAAAKLLGAFFAETMAVQNQVLPTYECHDFIAYLSGRMKRLGERSGAMLIGEAVHPSGLRAGQPYVAMQGREQRHSLIGLGDSNPDYCLSVLGEKGLLAIGRTALLQRLYTAPQLHTVKFVGAPTKRSRGR